MLLELLAELLRPSVIDLAGLSSRGGLGGQRAGQAALAEQFADPAVGNAKATGDRWLGEVALVDGVNDALAQVHGICLQRLPPTCSRSDQCLLMYGRTRNTQR